MTHKDCFGWRENANDFPYYDGLPVGISGLQWLFLTSMVALGFVTLCVPLPFHGA